MMQHALGRRGFPQRHGPLFRAPRRRGGDGGGFRALLRGRERAATQAVPAVVLPGRHARGARHGRATTRRRKPMRSSSSRPCRRRRASPTRSRCTFRCALGLIGKTSGAPLPLTLDGENARARTSASSNSPTPKHRFVFTDVAEEPRAFASAAISRRRSIIKAADRPRDARLPDGPRHRRLQPLGSGPGAGDRRSCSTMIGAARRRRADPVYLDAIGARARRAPTKTTPSPR